MRDVITIIDYDTTLQMEGLEEVIWGSMESQLPQLLVALERCGANHEADILCKARELTEEQEEEFENLNHELALRNDYDSFWDLVRNYIDKALDAL